MEEEWRRPAPQWPPPSTSEERALQAQAESQVTASRQDGVVAEWSDRGYGFILFADGRRAYVHHTSVNSHLSGPVDLKQGELVDAVLVEDAQNAGKWAALDVHRKSFPVPVCALAPGMAPGMAGVAEPAGAVREGAERMEGIVREWNPRGFGFVLFPDGRRAYVHHSFIGGGSALEPRNLVEGEAVVATLVEDAKNPGKWAATDVQRGAGTSFQQMQQPAAPFAARQLAAAVAPQLEPRGERLEGVVTEWSDRGYGFLQLCDGRRAYVHVSAFGSGNLVPGEIVNVVVVEDPQSPGKWQARGLQRGPVGEDGVVVEWRHESGYGFVAMEDGRRVYIHHSVFGGGDLQVGTRLRVQTKPDARNPGKWSVAVVKSDLGGAVQCLEQGPASPHHRACGANVVEWDLRGYGFVQTDDGRRVYVHHSSFGSGNLGLGERVSVVVMPDQRNPGKFMAQSLARDGGLVAQGCTAGLHGDFGSFNAEELPQALFPGGSGGCAAARAAEEEWLEGVVSFWHDDRGYGFIDLHDGRRLYVHHSAFGGGSLLQGLSCEAMVAPDKVNQGKWSATSVRGEAVLTRQPGEQPAGKRQRAA